MENFITFWFPIILTAIGIVVSITIACLFKYKWKPKSEAAFEENVNYAIELLFEKINRLDNQYNWLTDVIKEDKAITTRNEHCYNVGKGILDEIKNDRDYFEKYVSSQFLNYTFHYIMKTVTIMDSAKSNGDIQTGSEQRAHYAKRVLDLVKKRQLHNNSTKNLNDFMQRWKDS
ncbi:MAG: hypothetical protein OXI27_06115 [Thaumarchaeota archaeon]|nr:hypothetical protein [Nitrososphaerota archaeon]